LVVKVEALGQQDPEEPDDLSSLYFWVQRLILPVSMPLYWTATL
jgi:hypothetical protein